MIARRIVTAVVGLLVAVSVGGLIAVVAANVLVFNKFDAYGEVPIPGESTLYLPAGPVSVNFHVRKSGRGTAVPPLTMSIIPPPGVPDPEVIDDLGGSVTINQDVRRQVWRMRVFAEGGYRVTVRGPVGGYAQPRLAFGETGRMEGLLWVFAAMSVVSVDLAVMVWWFRRRRQRGSPASPPAAGPHELTGEGVRQEQLKTIAALRDSGALTESEFTAEKRRILEGR